ncbi:translocation/assembly module TamB domain-containing protein [Flavihumibacter profundi]|uniref:translocation/assembly module TamB domain-containing protein n=1 Tax=Flavihumibacter profundi TaxID=2716883 RepID=UPI001CC774FE|nr:translocation/assembly module TamB domain-containing protein [Flavihumibacter profundi]MBZ5856709.1 translocation/assembly module TamB [Flavihumibacter profundi]
MDILLLLVVFCYLLLQTSFVQNFLVQQAASRLSKALNTEVKISHVDLKFFNTLELKGTLVRDHNKDTLLYAGALQVNITDWFFLKDKIELKHIGLENTLVYLHRRDSMWNYQFLIDFFSSPTTTKKDNPISLTLKTVDIKNIRVMQHDEWRGENLGLSLALLHLETDEFNLANKSIRLKDLTIKEPVFSIYNYPGFRPPLSPNPNDTIPANNPDHLRWNSGKWFLAINNLSIENGAFRNDVQTDRKPYYYFDGAHFQFTRINGKFTGVKLVNDTISGAAQLTTRERSGFEVKQLKANIRFHPEAMEFRQLNIRTNKSHLQNYFAMRYDTFDNMSEFIEKVRMEGNFTDAVIHSDDIAFFAPELKDWNKRLVVTGKVKGTVEDMSGQNLVVHAGNNTKLSGEFTMKGLPDLDKTFLDFTANDFHTTYADLQKIVPEINQIKDLRIDRLEYMNFKGNFTGYFRNFVTYGTIETALGVIRTDVNMKIPAKGAPAYKGTIRTEGFKLGSFTNTPQIGSLAFAGDILGKGFTLGSLDASLNGNLAFIEYNGYKYSDISVDGKLANRLFNGNLAINDEHLEATLKGLVDLSGKVPRFDFNALINNANLRNLNFTKDEVDFNGTFNVNFVGSTIDNFIGEARVSDASVFKNGQRISFDSLYVESSLQSNGNKTITVKSNEFEGILAGEFNISSLPDAFQTFLNRYYPSYIAASKKKVSNNFSFFVTTRKVDDYLDLLDKNLKGFNYSTINGQVNTRENIFGFDADIPQFGYKKLGFYNAKLKARGTYDSLDVSTSIGDIFVNDSLHFPGTQLSVKSSNDISLVNIQTSANQTLKKANISGEVQTLKNGVRVMFHPSSFDINENQWSIDKGGELILSRELVTSDGIRLYSGDQEILITSTPSSIGKGNDLKIDLQKINIGDFSPFFVKSNRLEGLLSGSVEIIEPFGNLQVEAIARAEQFRLDNDSIGSIDLATTYGVKSGKVAFKTISVNEGYNFDIAGIVNTKDSLSDEIDINTNFNQTRINLLQQYLTGIFSKLEGKATGNLRIKGKANNLKYIGDVSLNDGGLLVDYTKVYYKIPAAQVKFTDGLIDFGKFQIEDTIGNKGELTEGKLYHNNFKDMAFDFKVRTNKLLLLNTTKVDNKLFYGNVIGKANMSFSGPTYEMNMDISGEPTDSSKIYIATESGRESAEADFIVWKQYGKEMEAYRPYGQSSNLVVSMDITANNKATVYMIIDETTGDIIQARGNGNLKMRVGTNEDLSMNGRYEIESGYYNFNFQAWKKTFKLLPDRGNSISWNGDPYEAQLKIDALYEADNVRFSDLLSSGGFSVTSEDVKRYRGKVNVIASITDRLTAPKIKFQIELPDNSALKNNSEAQALISVIQRDENELNKQVSYLILFNTFGPLTAAGSTTSNSGAFANAAFESLVVNSISGFLSSVLTNEFSKLLQNVFNDKSLKINFSASLYSGTNITGQSNSQITLPDRTNVNLSVAKSYMNERLTFVVGSAIDFGISAQQATTFQFLPDVNAEYKLTPDGKFRINFFYRNNWSYIAQSALQRSGVSFSYRREFDRFADLFRKKKKKKPAIIDIPGNASIEQ